MDNFNSSSESQDKSSDNLNVTEPVEVQDLPSDLLAKDEMNSSSKSQEKSPAKPAKSTKSAEDQVQDILSDLEEKYDIKGEVSSSVESQEKSPAKPAEAQVKAIPKAVSGKGRGGKMDNFDSFVLPESLQKSLARLNMTKPTDVQIQAMPHAIAGRDVIVSAPTGTGKTLAFSIPVVAKLIEDKNFGVIVITPTRELASQIITVMQSLLFFNKEVKSALLIGGAPMGPQLAQLRNKPQLIVGTPGRINDHLNTGRLNLDNTKFVVLDEMDRMLDMGFSIQIDEVLTYLKNEKQAMMLSATISPAIRKLSARYLNDPASVTIDGKDIVNTKIKQEFIHLAREHKYEELVKQLTEREGSVIIFVKTRRNAEDIADRLYNDNFRARSIHGDLRQNQRDKIIRLFRKGDFEIIVGTDVASRGLDVPHIKHVINYNLPTNPEDYVHFMRVHFGHSNLGIFAEVINGGVIRVRDRLRPA